MGTERNGSNKEKVFLWTAEGINLAKDGNFFDGRELPIPATPVSKRDLVKLADMGATIDELQTQGCLTCVEQEVETMDTSEDCSQLTKVCETHVGKNAPETGVVVDCC